MDIKRFMKVDGEKPLDNLVVNGGLCGIFRTIACIGDSLSSGEFESMMDGERGYHDYFEYSWGQYLARDVGCTVYNFSRGGMRAKEYCESFAKEKGLYSEELKAQAYIIALGVNDISDVVNGELEFGSMADIDPECPENNKPTFAGYYARIIADYKRIQPKAKFFLMTMPREIIDERREELYNKHAELLYKMAELFGGCYVLDLRKYAPLYDADFKDKFWLAGHLNAAGYRLTALMVESYIDYIIRNDNEAFTQIGFVGTEFYNEEYKW